MFGLESRFFVSSPVTLVFSRKGLEGYTLISQFGLGDFFFAMYIFRIPANKMFRLGKNADYISNLIWKTRRGEAATGGVLQTKFTEKYSCWSLFFNKVAGLRFQLYHKIDSNAGVFL